jgi:hypothetical protein
VQRAQIKEQLLEGCCRLVGKEFLNDPGDSFSLRIPGEREMMLISGNKGWQQPEINDVRATAFSAANPVSKVHAWIYQERCDVGGIVISSPKWAALLARLDVFLPPIFDEQVRHIGASAAPLKERELMSRDVIKEALKQGTNAILVGGRLLSLGMTRDRVIFNTELYEKCAQAYVLASACDSRIERIPLWVRLIATRRLFKDEALASASYRNGRIPKGMKAY